MFSRRIKNAAAERFSVRLLGRERLTKLAPGFLETIRAEFPDGQLVIEPRHITWFSSEVDRLLSNLRITRVVADPPICLASMVPGGDSSLVYIRLHGSPRMYYSSYDDAFLGRIASLIAEHTSATVWCIFDNTALGHATADALQLSRITRT